MHSKTTIRALLALVPTAIIANALPAQDEPAFDSDPAPEMKVFEPLLGKWSGSGTGKMPTPDGLAEYQWTGQSEYELVFDGHFVRETTCIDVPAMGGKIVMKTYFGYDKQTEKYVACGVDNMYGANFHEIYWHEPGKTMVTVHSGVVEGAVTGERWYTTYDDSSMTITGYQWSGESEEFQNVVGTMKKVDDLDPVATEAAAAVMPPVEDMALLDGMCGAYDFAGVLRMGPGMEMPVSGTEVFRSTLGGHVVEMEITAEPIAGMNKSYRAWGAYGWDHENDCYKSIYVSNFGEAGEAEVRFEGPRHLVRTATGLVNGQPMVQRGVTYMNELGNITRAVDHQIVGTNNPFCAFDARYELQD